ncbi:MAG: 23S rRNA (uridine(2552)-2'-O)-methyltransferase RlmE [Gammaproteobacteria bacterium]|nr:23S rRNA (uridine(2552)-2'-O)-methyltransferase RlmE [Gammaproteobacteria bacterium]
MARRSRSSPRWLREHFRDPFVRRARAEGWRSRAAFKLEQIDRRERLLCPGMTVLDLGAAPGAWSQYARRRVGPGGRVIASDLLPLEPLAGVEFLQGDLREETFVAQLLQLVGGRTVDTVLSDMAPNLAGLDAIDQPRALQLAERALEVALEVLKPGGAVLIKTFQGSGFADFVASVRRAFATVKFAKPAASRARSAELYVVGRGRR